MDNLLLFSEILLMFSCLLLLVINLYSYRVTRNKKILVASVLLVLFFLQALLAFVSEFVGCLGFMKEARVLLFVDVLAVLVIYLAIMKSG